MEQRCGKNDEEESYRKNLRLPVRPSTMSQRCVWLCARVEPTKDSPMIVLMPAMICAWCVVRLAR